MRIFVLSAFVLLSCLLLSGVESFADVAGGQHDFSIFGGSMFAFDSEQVCIFCHTPHGANVNSMHNGSGADPLGGVYLWNRTIPGQTFDVYRSSSIDYAGSSTTPQPGPESLLCLSCHDGIGAMNVLINPGTLTADLTGTPINQFGDAPLDPIISRRNIGEASGTGAGLLTDEGTGGANLANDHPVGFVYNATLSAADGTLVSPVSASAVDGSGLVRLFQGRVECSSCHNPHDNSLGSFLVMSNNGSGLCLQCHMK